MNHPEIELTCMNKKKYMNFSQLLDFVHLELGIQAVISLSFLNSHEVLLVISPVVKEGSNIRPVIIITGIIALVSRNSSGSNGVFVFQYKIWQRKEED